MALGDETGALEDLAAAIEIDPSDASAFAARALLHHQAERFEEAITDYDQSLELRPGDAATLNNRADARMLLGDLGPGAGGHRRGGGGEPGIGNRALHARANPG